MLLGRYATNKQQITLTLLSKHHMIGLLPTRRQTARMSGSHWSRPPTRRGTLTWRSACWSTQHWLRSCAVAWSPALDRCWWERWRGRRVWGLCCVSSPTWSPWSGEWCVLFFLLLRSQLCLWGSLFLVRFLHMWLFFNPTMEVAAFRLHGWWCVFLLPAFSQLRHECQDLLSPCDGMHVCTD